MRSSVPGRAAKPSRHDMISAGTPTVKEYGIVTDSPLFREMEEFSDAFIERNRAHLAEYSRKWVSDPLHQFNRQWEYPFAYDRIAACTCHPKEQGLSILDAGSGVTFFPYYLASRLQGSRVVCCDCDASLHRAFSDINEHSPRPVEFSVQDIHRLSFAEDHFDAIYCISVLEHTKYFEPIIKEFKRVLKGGGLMVVTFDISLDGRSDIPPQEAEKLLGKLQEHFSPCDTMSGPLADALKSPDIVNSLYIRSVAPHLLPWRHPFLGALRSLARFKAPKGFLKNLTFHGQAFTKARD